MTDLKGKTALVTGGTAGIGQPLTYGRADATGNGRDGYYYTFMYGPVQVFVLDFYQGMPAGREHPFYEEDLESVAENVTGIPW